MEKTLETTHLMTGLFPDRDSAERGYGFLAERGYTKDDVSLAMSEDTKRRHFGQAATKSEMGNKAVRGAEVGASVGGAFGAIAAVIAAAGVSVALPGVGWVIAGPLAAAVAGAAAGAATGGAIGALVGWGIPESRVKIYEDGLEKGGILMGFTPKTTADAKDARDKWTEHNAVHVYS